MIKLTNILLETVSLDKIDVLIKTDTGINKVEVYNQIRALTGVVVVTVEQSEFLDSKATDKFEYSLLHVKYLVTSDPKTDIDKIKTDALITTRIPGLLQFIPRYKTVQNIGKY
jgi:hypothetical protein